MLEARLQLLGTAKLLLTDTEIAFADDKRFGLLAYLAHKADWVTREQLADLFFGDSDSSTARKNLRHLIARTRSLAWLSGFETQLDYVRWLVPTDTQLFRQAVRDSDWRTALEVYSGAFLQTIQASESPGFALWLEAERQSLHDQWRAAMLHRANGLAQAGTPSQALGLLETLLGQDPFDEDALEQLMRLAVQADQHGLAQRSYSSFCERLHQELNLPPPRRLEQLAENIRGQLRPTAVALMPSRPRIPQPNTAFIGRELVLAELYNLLERQEWRLLCLIGTGGVGKTRIAVQLLLEQQALPDSAFVNLVPLSNPSAIAPAIAEALGLRLSGGSSALEQICAFVADKKLLLVLDNFEHLLEAKSQLGRLLQACPNLVLVVTSREVLGLQGEVVVPIVGFELPERHEVEDISSFEAVQLFMLHAKRVRPSIQFQVSDWQLVLEICRLVDGLPLGIELAAVWVRALPLEEIVSELGNNLDFLSSQNPDLPERHRSIRAAFEHSYALLTPEEQQALRRVSVFQGGFTRQAMRQVARLPLTLLSSLIDKSLLSFNHNGRYRCHRLLHQLMEEKLEQLPEEEAQSHELHAQYYFALLQAGLAGIRNGNAKAALEELEQEFANIRTAWRWAVEQRHWQFVKTSAEALMRFFDARGRSQEAILLFQEAISPNLEPAVLGTVLVHQAKFFERSNQLSTSATLTQQGLELLQGQGEHEAVVWGLGNLGTVRFRQGAFSQAAKHRQAALELARAIGNERLIAVCLGWVAIGFDHAQDTLAAQKHYLEAITIFKNLGNRIGALYNLHSLAALLFDLGEYQQANAYWLEALEFAKSSGELIQTFSVLSCLGDCHQKLGLLESAKDYCQQALEFEQQHALDSSTESIYVRLSLAALAFDTTAAKSLHKQALHHARVLQNRSAMLEVLFEVAQHEPNAQIFTLLESHPNTQPAHRQSAKRWLEGNRTEVVLSDPDLELSSAVQQILFGD
jgi:predicted ATPase/DNA-binding SARP family transcriptional activator